MVRFATSFLRPSEIEGLSTKAISEICPGKGSLFEECRRDEGGKGSPWETWKEELGEIISQILSLKCGAGEGLIKGSAVRNTEYSSLWGPGNRLRMIMEKPLQVSWFGDRLQVALYCCWLCILVVGRNTGGQNLSACTIWKHRDKTVFITFWELWMKQNKTQICRLLAVLSEQHSHESF